MQIRYITIAVVYVAGDIGKLLKKIETPVNLLKTIKSRANCTLALKNKKKLYLCLFVFRAVLKISTVELLGAYCLVNEVCIERFGNVENKIFYFTLSMFIYHTIELTEKTTLLEEEEEDIVSLSLCVKLNFYEKRE